MTHPAKLVYNLDNPFWRFSLMVYQHDEVKHACLELQTTYEINVNLLLLCCWLAYAVEPVSPDALEKAAACVENWHKEVTESLRNTRAWIKSHVPQTTWMKDFYQQLLVDELASEAYQQDLLYACFKSQQKNTFSKNEALATQYLECLFNAHRSFKKNPNLETIHAFVHLIFAMVSRDEQAALDGQDIVK